MSKYNGWTNRETWVVNLWMGEDWGYWAETIRESGAGDVFTVSDLIKAAHEDMQDEYAPSTSGPMADLLGAALASVNWDEIARHWVEDLELDQSA